MNMGRQGLDYRVQVFSTAYHISPNTLFFSFGETALSCFKMSLDLQYTALLSLGQAVYIMAQLGQNRHGRLGTVVA